MSDAQVVPPTQPSSIRHISSDEGLSQVSIYNIIKDENGFIWIGTIDGLNRFDGRSIIQYRYNPNDKNSICGNLINALYQDSSGRIWIGTSNQGVCYYKPDKGIFCVPKTEEKYTDIISKAIVTHIDEDKFGNIWISTQNRGILRLQSSIGNSFECRKIPIQKNNIVTTALYISASQKVWVGTENGEVFYSQIENENSIPKFTQLSNIETNEKVNCFIDNNQALWVGTDNGLWNVEKDEMTVTFYDLNTAGSQKTRRYYIYTMAFSSSDKLWVGAGNGLYCLQKKNDSGWFKQVSLYTKSDNNIISHNTIYSLLADSNLLWVGTAKNMDIFNFESPKFFNLTEKPGEELNNPIVLSIYKDSNSLWVGTAGGVNLFKNGEVFHYKENSSIANSISDDVVKSIIPDDKGNLWFGTTRGVSVIDMKSFIPEVPVFTSFYSDPNTTNSLSADQVGEVFLDRNNQIWITTHGKGINRFVGNIKNKDFSCQHFKHDPTNSNTISSNFVYCMAQDLNGDYWLGTSDGLDQITVLSADYSELKVKRHKHNPNNPLSISSNSVNYIFFDKNGVMWVGTKYGFNKYDKSRGTFQSYYTSDGLPNEFIYSIQEDDFGHLWLGTNKGLACFNKSDEKIIGFFTRDGLVNNEFNNSANCKDSEGIIYLGSIEGVTSFYPPDVSIEKEPVDVLITEILMPNPHQNEDGNSISRSMINLAVKSTETLKLEYNDFPLYIKFASPKSGPFIEPEYYYKLEPTDKEWNFLGERNEIQLLSLAPGSYSVLIAGGENGEVWENHFSKLELLISPPWWRSFYAYFSYLFITVAFIYLIIKLVSRQKTAIQESLRMKEVNDSKSRFYTNITHEFRTPLTVILGLAERLSSISLSENKNKLSESATSIKRNGSLLLNLVDQLLDMTKLRNGQYKPDIIQADVVSFIKSVIKNLLSYGEINEISIIENIEEDEVIMDYAPKALERILTNLINNAVKFSEKDNEVIICLQKVLSPPSLILKVKDSGIGIDQKNITNIFNRFYQVEDSEMRHIDGSGIGLSIVKELAQLMNGNVSVLSKLGHGSEFTVTLPISSKAKISSLIINTAGNISDDNTSQEINIIHENADIILIVEDNKDIAHYISTVLKDKYSLQYAQNGLIGSQIAIDVMPDIIISDIMMPKVDGYDMCKLIKSNDLTNHIPIILLTARVDEQDKLRGLKCGADAYINKPFNPEELNVRVKHLIQVRKEMKIKYSNPDFWYNQYQSGKINTDEFFLNKITRLILENKGNEHYKSSQLATDLVVSETQLYRKIKAITGKSTAIFIRAIRLRHAKHLLQNTNLLVSEIAYDTSFSDISYFSRVFKEEYGVSPSEARASC